jgi:glycosyltransferase involved in cell wall biosynthesis
MRVLIISWEYPPHMVGGVGTHVADLAPCLGGLETEFGPLYVDVLTTRFSGGDQVESVNEYVTIHRVDLPAVDPLDHYNSVIDGNSVFIEYAKTLAASRRYDLIHVHDWLTGEAGIVIKHAWKQPLLATMHATERGRHQGYLPSHTSRQIDRIEWKTAYEAWHVIACSEFMTDELVRFFSLPKDKITIIPNGISAPANAQVDRGAIDAMRRKYAPNDERLLFFVGRITYEKGIHMIVRAMPRILVQHPNTRLLIAGKNSQMMEQTAYELAVEDQVTCLGYVSDEERNLLYQTVDAAIFPSLYEPFGIVALEAMIHNCNVIVSATGGLREVIKHEVNGLTVIPEDPLSIAWAVNRLFTSPEEAAVWRTNALHDAQTSYRWSRIAALTANVYQNIHRQRLKTVW